VPCGVAVEEGVGVGVGDGAALLLTAPPPQPAMSNTRENKLPAANIGRARPGKFLGNKTHPTTKPKERASHILDISGKEFLFPLIVEALAAAAAVVLMKTLSLPLSMLRSMVLGRKLHCAPAGSPLQLNDNTPGRPEIVRASNSYLANPPAGTVIALGVPPETDREKINWVVYDNSRGLGTHVARGIASQHI